MGEILEAFILVFLAEMGDKSQLLAMTFATKYKLKVVIPGVFLGILLNHGIAVLVGSAISQIIDIVYISYVAAIVFLLFGLLSLKEEEDEEDGEAEDRGRGPILTIAIAFFLGEFGDKTQITAMTVASESASPLLILLGTVSAMILTSILGIFIGLKIGKSVPEKTIKMVSSIIFVFFGLTKLYSLMGSTMVFFLIFLTTVILEAVLLYRFHKNAKEDERLAEISQKLYEQNKILKSMSNQICKGEESCGTCRGEACLIGYVKSLLVKTEDTPFEHKDLTTLIERDYDKDHVSDALALFLANFIQYDFWKKEKPVNREIRNVFEKILFNKSFEYRGNSESYFEELKEVNQENGKLMEDKVHSRLKN